MEKRHIGALEVSIVGLGCNNFGRRMDAQATSHVVSAALEAGINFFDTADVYGGTKSEEFLGQALGGRRADAIIATKFGNQVDEQRRGAKPAYIRQAVEDSLRRLGTDYIDLYQLHVPDPDVPIADTMDALNDLVKAGKVREIGCSNFTVSQLQEAEKAVPPGGARFVSLQNHYSMLHREPEQDILPECARTNTAFLPYFPLANGLLTGKYQRGQAVPDGRLKGSERGAEILNDQNFALMEALTAFATSHGHTLLELAFSWLASQPVIASVIAGATSPAQIQANAAAVNWQLTEADFAAVDRILAAQD
jgi:aryl-alcohol dehydrogenase-like predicted oxidoreductase